MAAITSSLWIPERTSAAYKCSPVFDSLSTTTPYSCVHGQWVTTVSDNAKSSVVFLLSLTKHGLFNRSLTFSDLPTVWKCHKIMPIPKSGDLSKIKNYRPISLLCILLKVMESILYNNIIDFVRPKLSNY